MRFVDGSVDMSLVHKFFEGIPARQMSLASSLGRVQEHTQSSGHHQRWRSWLSRSFPHQRQYRSEVGQG